MLAKGDIVDVWPVGACERKAQAKVLIISDNQRSIAVGFADKPPFKINSGTLTLTLFAMRQASGRWREMVEGRLFEIERVKIEATSDVKAAGG